MDMTCRMVRGEDQRELDELLIPGVCEFGWSTLRILLLKISGINVRCKEGLDL